MDIIKDIFEVGEGIILPFTENSLYYKVTKINEKFVFYFSQNSILGEVEHYINIDTKKFLNNIDLSLKLFGNDNKVIVGMICPFHSLGSNILFLVDMNYFHLKIKYKEEIVEMSDYLIEPRILNKSLIGCEGNIFENGIPLDPVTMEPIPEEERFVLGNACYFKDTIRTIVNSDRPLDPLNREPIPQEIMDMFRIQRQNYITLNGNRYEIIADNLDLNRQRITNISPLSILINLRILYLGYNYQLFDISPLSRLNNLELLALNNTRVSNIDSLSGLTMLRNLDLSSTKITNISSLSGLINLISLDLSETEIVNINPLSRLVNLINLHLSDTKITNVNALSRLINLKSLSLNNTFISDIRPLSNLINLNLLFLNSTNITNIEPLSNLINLELLHLYHTRITNFDPLSNLSRLRLHR